MIVQRFLAWVGGAPAGERADAASALARAYLHSPLDPGDRAAAEAAMTVLLDDASPLVRLALAEALGASPDAPRAIIHALAFDTGEIAAVVLSRSPLLSEAELVDAVAVGDWRAQCSVACRVHVPASLGGAIAEVGDLDACRALLDNPGAELTPGTLARLLARHGRDAGLRTRLLARPDLPAGVRQMAVAALAEQLSGFAAGCGWLTQERARRVAHEARDKATVTIAVLGADEDIAGLVRHLREHHQLTTALILRALLSGHLRLVEEALHQLSGLPLGRVSGLLAGRPHGYAALHARAGLPAATLPAFQAALAALAEEGPDGVGLTRRCDARLSRRMTERVLTGLQPTGAHAGLDGPETAVSASLLLMLRRFAAEAARDEAHAVATSLVRDLMMAA